MSKILPHSLFTTDQYKENDRFAAWREDISLIFQLENLPFEKTEDYHATFDLYNFGQSVLAELHASPSRYVRSAKKSRQDGLDAILVQLILEGEIQFNFNNQSIEVAAGDIIIFDLTQQANNINTAFRHLTFMVARDKIEPLVPDIWKWHGLALPRESASVQMLRNHLVSSFNLASKFNVEEGLRMEDATVTLVAAAMSDQLVLLDNSAGNQLNDVISNQIKQFIRNNLEDDELSPQKLASVFKISRAQLYRLMEPLGGLSGCIRAKRLDRCWDDLKDASKMHLNISEIAYRWGFKNMATFNRNFRQVFGKSPGEVRAEAVLRWNQTEQGIIEKLDGRLESHHHHKWFRRIGV
jgi:AraC-like DNA-binding protein